MSDENSVDEMEISVSFARNEPDTNLLGLKESAASSKQSSHREYDIPYNHGSPVDPARQPALKTEDARPNPPSKPRSERYRVAGFAFLFVAPYTFSIMFSVFMPVS